MPNDDYIKRNDVKTAVFAWYVDEIEQKYLDKVIAKIPAANVEPVRRGKWEYDSDGVPHCSQCGEFALQRLHLYIKNKTFDAPFKLTDYCPNCGAKMDKEEA